MAYCGKTCRRKAQLGHREARRKSAIGDGVSWKTPCKRKAQPEAQLGAREAKAVSLGGSVVARIHR